MSTKMEAKGPLWYHEGTWLVGWAGWLAGLAGWLAGSLAGWLAGWLAGPPPGKSEIPFWDGDGDGDADAVSNTWAPIEFQTHGFLSESFQAKATTTQKNTNTNANHKNTDLYLHNVV